MFLIKLYYIKIMHLMLIIIQFISNFVYHLVNHVCNFVCIKTLFAIRNPAKLIPCNIVEYILNAFIFLNVVQKNSFNRFLMEKF